MTERDELISQLAERLAAVEAEKKAFHAEYLAAKEPIDRRKKEEEIWELAQTRMAHITSQLVGLKPHFARECEKIMPAIWTAAKRYFAESADAAGKDGTRRTIFDQATGKLSNLFLVPGDLTEEVSAIRKEVGEKLAALEHARAKESLLATAPAGLRKSRPITAEQFAAAHCEGVFVDTGVVAEIEAG